MARLSSGGASGHGRLLADTTAFNGTFRRTPPHLTATTCIKHDLVTEARAIVVQFCTGGAVTLVGCSLSLPCRLREGDLVAVVAPSGPVMFPERLGRGVRALESVGFRPVVGPVASGESGRRSAQERADELNAFLRAPDVRAIVAAIGGYSSNALLDLLDWEALRADPKILVGYSDITALLMGAVHVAGVPAFHGPTVLPELAEYPEALPDTADGLRRAVCEARPLGVVAQVPNWTEEFLAWEKDDNRARCLEPATPWRWIGDGTASGRLLGGNLETLCALAGTRYFPDFTDAVVLLESAAVSHDAIDRDLDHLSMLGVFDGMAGLVFGHSFRGGPGFQTTLEERLIERFAGAGAPVVLGVHLGHTDPMPTLPLGVPLAIDVGKQRLEVLDAAVR
jgi:muramoyltetrapeptide carboxypeptidase